MRHGRGRCWSGCWSSGSATTGRSGISSGAGCSGHWSSCRAGRTPFEPSAGIAERVKQAALDRGLGVYPSVGTADGVRGDDVIVAPLYIVTGPDLMEIVGRLGKAVDAVFA